MNVRLMAVVSAVLFAACGGSEGPNDGGSMMNTGCTTKPFGNYTGTQCDGGAFGSFTFYSDGGVTWQQSAPIQCSTDSMGCSLLMTCAYDPSSPYAFDLQSSRDAQTFSGSVLYQGRTICVQLAK